MIRNTLAQLMGIKGLKISDVHRSTGIARTTLSQIYSNTSTSISFEVLDKLLQFLEVTPSGFFEYVPLGYDIRIKDFREDEVDNLIINLELVFVDKHNEFVIPLGGKLDFFPVSWKVKNIYRGKLYPTTEDFEGYVDGLHLVKNKLGIAFQEQIRDEIQLTILKEARKIRASSSVDVDICFSKTV